MAAVLTGAAEGGVAFSRVTVNGGKPIVIGVKEEVEVYATFRMTTKLKHKSGPTVFPYRGKLSNMDTLWNSIITSDCKVVNKATGKLRLRGMAVHRPAASTSETRTAGTWGTAARLFLPKDSQDVDDENLPLQVKRATRVTVNAAPEPVVKGRTITVTGKVSRANWDTHTYQGYGGRSVSLQFKAAGSSSYKTVKKATSSKTGALKTTVKATVAGTWRWTYYGNTTSGASSSSGDRVAIR